MPAIGSDEVFHYGYAHRVLRMDVTWDGMPVMTCPIDSGAVPATFSDVWQWQYNYSPTGERETKRLMRSPRHDSSECGAVLPRVHYLLDAADRQMVVYHGRQTANLTYCNPTQTVRRVFLYPMEYRMYGPDGVAVVWERDQNAQLVPRAVSTDAQGSERYVHGTGMALSRDYRAFGVELGLMQPQRRTGWIGKERDHETSPLFPAHKLMDLSARRYDPMTALFTSVDELWATFPQQHGYHYAYHDPVNFRDPSGMEGEGDGGDAAGNEPLSNPLVPLPGRRKSRFTLSRGDDWADQIVAARHEQLRVEASFLEYTAELAAPYPVPPTPWDQRPGVQRRLTEMSREVSKRDGAYDPNSPVEIGAIGVRTSVGYQMNQPMPSGSTPGRWEYNHQDLVAAGNFAFMYHTHPRTNGLIASPGIGDVMAIAELATIGTVGIASFVRADTELWAVVITDLNKALQFTHIYHAAGRVIHESTLYDDADEWSVDQTLRIVWAQIRLINTIDSGIRILRLADPLNHEYEIAR